MPKSKVIGAFKQEICYNGLEVEDAEVVDIDDAKNVLCL